MCGWEGLCVCGLNALGNCVWVCVFSPITQGRGKSFHFLDESLVNQKPRDLLLALCTASLFLSHLPLSFHLNWFYTSNPQTFAINSPLHLSFISFPPSSLFSFSSFCPLGFPPPPPLNHSSFSALHLFIFLSLSLFPPTTTPTPPLQPLISALAESALPFCSPLQTHKRTDLHFYLAYPISVHFHYTYICYSLKWQIQTHIQYPHLLYI